MIRRVLSASLFLKLHLFSASQHRLTAMWAANDVPAPTEHHGGTTHWFTL